MNIRLSIASLILLAAGGFMSYEYYKDKVVADASLKWPTVEGRIVESEVQSVRHKRSTSYKPRITYSYTVDGNEYESKRLSFPDPDFDVREAAVDYVSRYGRPDARVEVHYDAKKPAESCLQPGEVEAHGHEGMLALLMLGGGIAIPGVSVAVNRWKMSRVR